MGEHGWPFASVDPFPAAGVDPVNHAEHAKDLYLKADPNYEGRFTVPILWDKKHSTIVNNESSEIIRIFNTAFNDLVEPEKAAVDIYPEQHRAEIDGINEWVYDNINSESMIRCLYLDNYANLATQMECISLALRLSLKRMRLP